MNTATPCVLRVERVDDIPVLFASLQRLQVAEFLDRHFPTHHLWKGERSFGEVVCVWLVLLTCQGDHRLYHLLPWVEEHLLTLQACLGKSLRPLDFHDDRLADVLDALAQPTPWQAFEADLNGPTVRVYALAPSLFRIDTTTASSYAEVLSEHGLLQFGHSKDRDDLPQLKIAAAALDPLGLPVSTLAVAGNSVDDPWYIPEIPKVQRSFGAGGKTYYHNPQEGWHEWAGFGENTWLSQIPLSTRGDHMPGSAARIRVTERHLKILQDIAPSRTATVALVQRATLILRAFDKIDNQDIADEIDLNRNAIGLWRRRWAEAWLRLIEVECTESWADLRRAIEDVLSDASRPGNPGKFTAEQVTQILALACEPPEKSGRPITHWTAHEWADEARKRGIVASISASQVNRSLNEAELQPHRSRYWLNTKEKDPQQFQEKVEAVCDGSQEAPRLYAAENTHTICTEEMTGIQARSESLRRCGWCRAGWKRGNSSTSVMAR